MWYLTKNKLRLMLPWVILIILALACGNTSITPVAPVSTATIASTETTLSSETSSAITPTAALPPTPVAEFLLDSNANIRSGPGTEHSVIMGAQAGDTLQVYAKNEDGTWLLIDPINYLWISITLGTLSSPIDTIPLAPPPPPTGPITSSTSTAPQTSTEDTPGLTEWLVYDGAMVRIVDLSWDYSIDYARAEDEKIFLSIYIVIINNSDRERTFPLGNFTVIDGSGTVNTPGWFFAKEPALPGCTLIAGGTCEGWWTTQVLDRPEVRDTLTFRWNTGWFTPMIETPIEQGE